MRARVARDPCLHRPSHTPCARHPAVRRTLLANQHGRLGASTIGTLAGAVVGAVLGTFVFPGVGTALGASIGATLGGLVGGTVEYLTAPDQVNRAESIAGMQVQTSAYGQPMAQIFPPWRVAGNIIWMSVKYEHEHRETRSGKGGGPQQVSITKTYTVSLALALCDTLVTGPMQGIRKVWADGTLIYAQAQGPAPINWAFYGGNDDQPADGTIAAYYSLPLSAIPAFIHTCYVVMNHYDMGAYPRVPNFTFEVYGHDDPAGVPLPSVVTTLCGAAGQAVDVADLPDARVRLGLTAVQSVRAVLEQLTVAYRVYLLESGGTLVGRPLGSGGVLARIPEGDLDASAGEGAVPVGLVITRERTRVLPTQLSVSYIAPSRSFQQSTQLATIGSLETVETSRAVSTSVGLDDADAKALAQESLDRVWIERTGYAFTVGRRWAWLEPGDRIEVESRSYVHTIVLTEVEYGRPGLVICKGRADSAPVMFVEGAAPATGITTDQILDFLAQTAARFVDLPAMDSTDQAPRTHVIYAYGKPEGWPGATLHRSADGGDSYAILHVGTLEAIAGTALTVLPDAPAHLTDTVSTVQVHLDHGQIVSVTPQAFQAGGNLAMLGSELVQFREAVLIGEATYELRHLWRGRRGTGWATDTHVAGERFTWIDRSVYAVEMALADRSVPRQWKAVTRGLDITTATPQTYAPPSDNLRPWPVATLRLDHVGEDWLISWRGTARFSGFWIDGSQATPDPDFLSYRVIVYTDGTGATMARQVDVADSGDWQARQVYTYTSAMQSADFGSVQTVLYATVAQVGRYDVSRMAA